MCAGCTILKRSFRRTSVSVPEACTKCYDKYFWDGTLNSITPVIYDPALSIGQVKVTSAAPSLVSSPSTLAVVVTLAVGVALLT